MCAYQKNKPQAADKLKNSQGDLLGNFQALNDAFEVNHDISTFTSPASGDEGKHNKVDLTDQTSSIPTPASGQTVLYEANDVTSGSGRKELWANLNSALIYPITAGKRASKGWARIGGGVYLIWGQQTSDANTSADTTIDLTHAPASGNIQQVVCTPFTTTDDDYTIIVTQQSSSTKVGIYQRSVDTATRLASKTFNYFVIRL